MVSGESPFPHSLVALKPLVNRRHPSLSAEWRSSRLPLVLCTTTGGGGRERAGDAAPEGEEEDNIVTTIDEVCVSLAANATFQLAVNVYFSGK